MNPSPALGRRPIFRDAGRRTALSPGGLLSRLIGMAAWRLARADSLPVPPLRGDEIPDRPAWTGSRLILARATRAFSIAAICGSVFAIAIGGIATREIRAIERELVENPDGNTLLQQADELETSLAGVWWARLYPGYPERAARMAQTIRSGRSALLEAAQAYTDCARQLSALGLPARLLHGPAIVAPVSEALEKVPTQFHRETVTYQQIDSEIGPYLKPEQNRSVVQGVLVSCPPNHGLLIAGLDGKGVTRWKIAGPLLRGKEFKITLEPVEVVRLTDLYRPSGATDWQMGDQLDVPFQRWTDGRIRLPHGDPGFEIEFSRESLAQAPKFPKLSPYARAAIAPMPSNTHGG